MNPYTAFKLIKYYNNLLNYICICTTYKYVIGNKIG